MHDVIVVDEEHKASATNFRVACAGIDDIIDRYIGLMEKALQSGLMSGNAAEALKVFINYAKTLRDAACTIAGRNRETSNAFLNSIDEADQYLF